MGALKYFLNRRFLLVAAALLASCVGANMMALALFLLVRPFSRSLYRRLVAQYVACMWIDALSLLLPGANIQITADSDMPDGACVGCGYTCVWVGTERTPHLLDLNLMSIASPHKHRHHGGHRGGEPPV